MATFNRYRLTPEQIALSEERKAKKLKAALPSPAQNSENSNTGSIIERSWIPIETPQESQQGDQRVKIFTWNLLAQCLVRRTLFPTSDCLKAGQREHMLYRELLSTQADILCLQEVDRLEKILPALEKAGYAHHYAAGPGKKHGCLIAFKERLYTMLSARTVVYDIEPVRGEGDDNARRGRSFHTKNVGSLVSLQSKSAGKTEGVIVATTHLFWHPRFVQLSPGGYIHEVSVLNPVQIYLREGEVCPISNGFIQVDQVKQTRQAGILVRETVKFRAELEVEHWPCIIGGDFNFAPDDIAYSLLVGDAVLPQQKEVLEPSYVVHRSVDPTVMRTPKVESKDDDEEEGDSDKVITSARPAAPSDGLLSPIELSEFFSCIPRVRSAYDVGLAKVKDLGELQMFGSRVTLEPGRRGCYEPAYTSYTHYWKTTLDYLFVLDPVDRPSNVVALLSPYRTKDLERGLPQKGVSSSDHVSLAADFHWPKM
ncbi:hypothetical protein DXG01_000141 [Tephrocybe rancida]|nr:hypothetical protein DXG01_000141 [Tephrocybe rancida]